MAHALATRFPAAPIASTRSFLPRFASLAAILLALAYSACASSTLEPMPEEAGEAEFLLSTTNLELTSGDTFRIHVTAPAGDGAPPTAPPGLRWASSDTSIATVDGTGLVSAQNPGNATVTASRGNSKKEAKVKVRGRGSQRPSQVTVSPGEATLRALGRSVKLEASVLDQHGKPIADPVLTWSSRNPAVATVDEKGNVLAKAVGIALITASSSGAADTVQVTVIQVVAKVEVSPKSAQVGVGDTVRLQAMATDSAGASVKQASFSWSSSDSKVATVDGSGLVKGVAGGSVKITAAHGSGGRTVSAAADVGVKAKEDPSDPEDPENPDSPEDPGDPEDPEDPEDEPDPGPPGPSTEIRPGDDIQAKVNSHPPGTSFRIKAGVHRMQDVQPKDGQQFIGEPGAVLSGARLLTAWSRSGGLWVNREARVVQSPSGRSCEPGFDRCSFVEDLFLDNKMLRHVGSVSRVVPGTFHFDHGSRTVYLADDPTGRTVEIGQTSRAFGGSVRDVVIRGLTIEKYANREQRAAVHPGGSGWVIEDNLIRQNHGRGVNISDRTILRGNRILANGQLGVGGAGDDVVVEGNEIAFNNAAGYRAGWEAGGTKFVKTRNLVVRNNHVHDNFGSGLWTDIDNIHTLYEGNRVEDNAAQGIFHEISYDAVIRHNIVRRNGLVRQSGWLYGAGILVAHSPNVEVYGNTVEDNWNGIAGIQQPRGTGAYGPRVLRNLWVHDNTVRMTRGRSGLAHDGDPKVLSAEGNNRFDRNRYFVDGLDKSRWHWSSSEKWPGWRARGQDVNGSVAAVP